MTAASRIEHLAKINLNKRKFGLIPRMSNFINNIIQYLSGPELTKQIFGAISTIITGWVLLKVGFRTFKKQEKFKASSNEIKALCDGLNKSLKAQYDLDILCRFIESNLQQILHLDPRKLASVIGENDRSKNSTLFTILKSLRMKSAPIERPLDFHEHELLLELIYNIEILQIAVITQYNMTVDTIGAYLAEIKYEGEEKPSEMEINNIWSCYLESKDKFHKLINMFKPLSQDGIHGRMDITEFNNRLALIDEACSDKPN